MGNVVDHKVLLVGTLGGPLDNWDCSIYLFESPFFPKKNHTLQLSDKYHLSESHAHFFYQICPHRPPLKKKKAGQTSVLLALKVPNSHKVFLKYLKNLCL